MALRKGVRHIDLEITKGANGPLVGGVRLEEVLETIKKTAFITSKYPLILDVKCGNQDSQAVGELLREVLGSSLLTEKVGNPEELPSPEQLKGKIILSTRINEDFDEELNESVTEHPVGEVWYLSKEEDEKRYWINSSFKTQVSSEWDIKHKIDPKVASK